MIVYKKKCAKDSRTFLFINFKILICLEVGGGIMSNLSNAAMSAKIACILDGFSYNCFKYEADLIPLEAEKWEETFIQEKPVLLFVESAWNETFNKVFRHNQGANGGNRLLRWCKMQSIPTVFWNKEDPVYFDQFIEIAKDFDYILTTEVDSIPKYKKMTGHDQVYVLPFAAQVRIHNPIDKDAGKLGKIAFAGTWYKRLPARAKEMEMLLRPALKYGLHIYDRMYNSGSNYYKFPKIYQPYIKGSLPYEKMVSLYKKYDIFLNVNTVKTSPTMLARRVIELLACGINVISNDSLAVRKMFPGIVQVCENEEDAESHINLLINDRHLRDRLSLLGQREVFQKHTYTHRMERICEIVGLNFKQRELPGVSFIAVINSQSAMACMIENFERQTYPTKELILILNYGSNDLSQWQEKIESDHRIQLYLYDERQNWADTVKEGIGKASFNYISFFEEDNYYAPAFTGDLMNAFQYSRAEVVGKCTYYTYLRNFKKLFIRYSDQENRFTDSVLGSAMIARKEILEKIKFSDVNATLSGLSQFTEYFKGCSNQGVKIYATDRYNFVHIDTIADHGDFQKLCSNSTWRMVDGIDTYETHVVL